MEFREPINAKVLLEKYAFLEKVTLELKAEGLKIKTGTNILLTCNSIDLI